MPGMRRGLCKSCRLRETERSKSWEAASARTLENLEAGPRARLGPRDPRRLRVIQRPGERPQVTRVGQGGGTYPLPLHSPFPRLLHPRIHLPDPGFHRRRQLMGVPPLARGPPLQSWPHRSQGKRQRSLLNPKATTALVPNTHTHTHTPHTHHTHTTRTHLGVWWC